MPKSRGKFIGLIILIVGVVLFYRDQTVPGLIVTSMSEVDGNYGDCTGYAIYYTKRSDIKAYLSCKDYVTEGYDAKKQK